MSSRPLFHFVPRSGWMNDPNGLVYFGGEWHLFYQYFQPADGEGMQWGHAVSRDLQHWQHLPAAIRPDEFGHIWSGSAVVDHQNSSGLFAGRSGIACLYTYFCPADGRQFQGLAYSEDGRTFRKHPPVIPQLRHLPGQVDDKDFRDPKVFWHEPTQRWIMAVAGGKLRIFSSTDLVHWDFQHVHEQIHTECPDLFEMPIQGTDRHMWVLSGGGRWYMLGQFDGKIFTPETGQIVMGFGPDYYATQTWDNAPKQRRIAISWLFNWNYGSKPAAGRILNPFPTDFAGGCLSVPYEFKLVQVPGSDSPRLMQVPVEEITKLRGEAKPIERITGGAADVELEMNTPRDFVLTIGAGEPREVRVAFDASAMKLRLTRTGEGLPANYAGNFEAPVPAATPLRFRILIDRCSVEVFAGEGQTVMSAFIVPTGEKLTLSTAADVRTVAYATHP